MTATSPAQERRRVLVVARDFYPASYISCHRTGKFCKYLGDYGWQPLVLTPRAELTHGPPHDPALLEQLPADVEIVRTGYPDERRIAMWIHRRLAGPGSPPVDPDEQARQALPVGSGLQRWLSVPDWTIYWLPWALHRGWALARRSEAVYVTAPPKGAALVATVIARLARRPLLIDLRDPWFLERTTIHPTRLHRLLDDHLERWCVHSARTVVLNTPRAREAYVRRYPKEPPEKFVTIPNGFDPADYDAEPEGDPRGRGEIRFSYFGSLYLGRDPRPLMRVAKRVQRERGAGERRLALCFWSVQYRDAEAAACELGAGDVTVASPPVPHREALRAMRDSDVLLMFGDPDTDELHVAGKLFEYVYCRRPILALVEEGAISDLIERYRLGLWCEPRDEARLEEHVRTLVRHAESGEAWPTDPSAFHDFDRREHARQLAMLLSR